MQRKYSTVRDIKTVWVTQIIRLQNKENEWVVEHIFPLYSSLFPISLVILKLFLLTNILHIYQQTPQQFSEAYKARANDTNVQTSLYGPFGFDTAWLVAIALNSSIHKLSDPWVLNIKDLIEDNATAVVKDSLLSTKFLGVTVSTLNKNFYTNRPRVRPGGDIFSVWPLYLVNK